MLERDGGVKLGGNGDAKLGNDSDVKLGGDDGIKVSCEGGYGLGCKGGGSNGGRQKEAHENFPVSSHMFRAGTGSHSRKRVNKEEKIFT